MALRGQGAVAIWHDIAPAGRADFYDWHGHEHMAERVAIPGFLRGRRYIALEADLEFFNLYEADNLAVLDGEGYKMRLNNPTPWTVSTVAHFREVNRALCTVAHSSAIGCGGLITTIRYDAPDETDDALWSTLLAPLVGETGVAGVHLLVADRDASSVSTAETEARGRANVVPSRAILVEGWGDSAAFTALCRERLAEKRLNDQGAAGPIQMGHYQLQLALDAP